MPFFGHILSSVANGVSCEVLEYPQNTALTKITGVGEKLIFIL